jgi:hypothetical protein
MRIHLNRVSGGVFRILASALVGMALGAGGAVSILAQHSSPSVPAGTIQKPTAHPITGAVRSGVVNLATLPPATAADIAHASQVAVPVYSRQTPAQLAAYRQWALSHPSSLPKATASKEPSSAKTYGNGAKPVLVSEHDGLSQASGGGLAYPAPALAVAPGYVFEGTNDLLAVYTWSYAVKYGPWTADQLFASIKHTNAVFVEPQITYDAERNKYLIVWLEIDGATGRSYFDIGVSKTSTPSPLTNFRVYQFDTTSLGSNVLCESPTLGYDYWAMYITCTTFSLSNGTWTGNETLAFSINKMLNGTGLLGSGWSPVYTDVSCGTGCFYPAYRVSPTIEDGVPQAEWVTATDQGLGVVSSGLILCAVTNSHGIEGGSAVSFTCVNTALPDPYSDPIAAAQKGTAAGIMPDYGYKQVAYRNGQLYFAVTAALTCSGNTHDGIYWAAFDPQLTTEAAHNPQWSNGIYSNYSQAGYYCYLSSDAFTPALIADTEGDMTLVYNFTNATNYYPSVIYTGRAAADAPGTMDQSTGGSFVVIGSQPNDSGKWGFYATCALSTNMVTRGVVFCVNEYGGAHAGLGSTGWDTELYQVRME